MILLGSLMPVLQSPALTPAFTNMIPALLGALATPFFLKDFRTASVPMALAAILTLILGYAVISQLQAFIMPVMLAVAIGWSYFLFKRKKKAEAALESKEINK
jgi:purine-cytosine permease-like protein